MKHYTSKQAQHMGDTREIRRASLTNTLRHQMRKNGEKDHPVKPIRSHVTIRISCVSHWL